MIRAISYRATAINVLSFAAAISLFAIAGTASAAAPMVKNAEPGNYYRMMLGDFEVTALSDGTLDFPISDRLTNIARPAVDAALAKFNFNKLSVNAFLINTGTKLILVDAGAGSQFGPAVGKLIANLKTSGYQPAQIDEVYITHMHGDHIGGLMLGDKLAFPNATVRANKHESDFWLSQANLDKAPDASPSTSKRNFQRAMELLNPYVKADKFKPFDGDVELAPGIKSLERHGHTPGHSVYVVESKGQKLALLGDLLHAAIVQFETPSVGIASDTDSDSAATQREAAFADAAKQGYLVGGAHLVFPGLGHVRTEGKAYAWEPVSAPAER